MLLKLHGAGPLYRRIYRALRGKILAGDLGPGARLPSTRALAQANACSRNTALIAYDQLAAEGYISGRRGAGCFVSGALPGGAHPRLRRALPVAPAAQPSFGLSAYAQRVAASRRRPEPGPMQRYDFRYGVPSERDFPDAAWRRLLARNARDATLASRMYGDAQGLARLRREIASYLSRSRAVDCSAEQVLIVNGAQQALDLAARTLLDPGDTAAIEDPCYLGARQAFAAAGARLVPVGVDADGLDIGRLTRAPARLRLVYATPSHQFPTGVTMPLARRLALLDWLRAQRAWLIEDDYDSEHRYEGRPIEAIHALDDRGQVLYVGTLSKTLFPALRLGYLVLPPALVEPFVAVKHVSDRHTPTLAQEVLADFIGEGHYERYLRRTRRRNAARRKALLVALARHFGERIEISGANAGAHMLVWLTGVRPARTAEIVARAAEAGVGVYSAAPYYFGGAPHAGLLLGYANLEPAEIDAGVARLARAIGGMLRAERPPGRRSAHGAAPHAVAPHP